MRRTAHITALALILGAAFAAPASATFPGENGPILYRTLDFRTGLGKPLIRALSDGSQPTVLNRRPGYFSDWRADGRRVAFDFFQRNGSEQIATMDPDGGNLRVITHGPGIHEVPSWSPDGGRIVFDYSGADPSRPGFQTRLWVMRADGSHARPLPMRQPGFDVEPKYSPDGRWIVFARLLPKTRRHEVRTAILTVPANGGRVHRLTPWTEYPDQPTPQDAYVEHPTWSPDSKWILFNVAPNGSIQAMRPDGSDRHTIRPATRSFGGHKPSFSPDGTRIVLMCENQGTRAKPPKNLYEHICVMDADGSNLVHLTDKPGVFENWPSWGPAPEGLAEITMACGRGPALGYWSRGAAQRRSQRVGTTRPGTPNALVA